MTASTRVCSGAGTGPLTSRQPRPVRSTRRTVVSDRMRTPRAVSAEVSARASRKTPPLIPANTGPRAVGAAEAARSATAMIDSPERAAAHRAGTAACSESLRA